ncbi:MAG: tetratricopeptide repeat protein [Pseudomonadota bacterium]
MAETGFFSELWRRRVPQFLGFYVAATWMAVEIGDWMIERFSLPENLTSYVFLGMVSLIPAVGVIAWGHGAPGKDRWTKFQAGFIGLNAAAAIAALALWVQPMTAPQAPAVAAAATETVEVLDEDGNVEFHEVAKDGYHQSLLAFFFRNMTGDTELDWLSYGAPWLITEDLRRNPLIAIGTPLSQAGAASRLREKGFPNAVGEPLSLDLQIARDRGLPQIITGEIARLVDGTLELTARLIEVETGQMVNEWKRSGADVLDTADQISGDIRESLLSGYETDRIVTELSIKEHTSENLEAIRHAVEAQRLRSFENNYPAAIEELKQAIEKDPTFAEAHVLAHLFYRNLGDYPTALAEAQKALAHDYKLYSETKFMLKANMQALQGRADQAVWVLERWAQIHPQSGEVQGLLGSNYLVMMEIAKAKGAYQRLLELEPSQRRTLLSLAAVLRLEGDLDNAIATIQRYIEEVQPENAEAHMDLGNTYIQAGQFEQAREAYEEAAFLDATNPRAEIALAGLLLREGAYDQALTALKRIEARNLPPRQLFAVLGMRQKLHLYLGEVELGMESLRQMSEAGSTFMPPFLQVFQIENSLAIYQAMLSDKEGALQMAAETRAKLKPPFDGYALFAPLDIYSIFKEAEPYLKVFEELEQSSQLFSNPTMELVVDWYRARGQLLSGDTAAAVETSTNVLQGLGRSAATLQSPDLMESFIVFHAHTLAKAGRVDEALDQINGLVDVNPGMSFARVERLAILLQKGLVEAAQNEADYLDRVWESADKQYVEYKRLQELKAELATAQG